MMQYRNSTLPLKPALWAAVLATSLMMSSLPALAQDPGSGHEHQPAPEASPATSSDESGQPASGEEQPTPIEQPTSVETSESPEPPAGCRCDLQDGHHGDGAGHHEGMQEHHGPGEHQEGGHDHRHHGEDTDYGRAFAEGTPELFSPSVLNPDTLTIAYSHQFFFSSLPRGSNPAFSFKYSPLDQFQIDALATLRSPLELELGLAYQILDEDRGDWLNLTPRLAYNSRGNLVGGELAANKYIFPELWQVGLDARLLSTGAPDGFARPVAALGFNTMLRVWKHWHLYGDVVVPLDGEILQKRSVLWTAGLKKRIPHTPHILTLFVGNTQEQSLSGRTISSVDYSAGALSLADTLRLGFLFSIQIDGVSQLPARIF